MGSDELAYWGKFDKLASEDASRQRWVSTFDTACKLTHIGTKYDTYS